MKPLSPILYSKRNKKKVFVSINAVMLAVAFLYILYSFIQSVIAMEARNNLYIYDNTSIVKTYEEKPIGKELIKGITNNKNVDRIVPTKFDYRIRFEITGASDGSRVLPIKQRDINYVMKAQNIKLIQGRMPKDGTHEIAINNRIAKNKKVKIGGRVGSGVNKFDGIPGEYKIVGIIESKALISIASVNEKLYKNQGFLVFPKKGRLQKMNKYLEKLPKHNADINTKSIAIKDFERSSGVTQVLDIIAILSIIVMVITVGSSRYVQYINRKEELGVLNAIGYNKKNILGRVFKEVCATNTFGYILGTLLGVAISFYLTKALWEPKGADGFLCTTKGIIVSLFVPLFTILFSVIPVNNLVGKLDPIKMIEKN